MTYEEYLKFCPPHEARMRAIMDKKEISSEEVEFVIDQIASMDDPEAEHVTEDQLCHKVITMAAEGHDIKAHAREIKQMLLKSCRRWYA